MYAVSLYVYLHNSLQYRILCVCHGVLYKQLSAWMLHGLLLDKKGEFFIERIQHSLPEEVTFICKCLSEVYE